jgi:hypothetical protein
MYLCDCYLSKKLVVLMYNFVVVVALDIAAALKILHGKNIFLASFSFREKYLV